jgi:hypothetical protein
MKKKKIYGNCKVNHPDGSLMFLCLPKKAHWYLSRGLAKLISEEPLVIQLTFEPKGRGAMDKKYTDKEREYLLGEKKNVCVVCGTQNFEALTKHHVVPQEYRKHFPVAIKSRASHDVVLMCVNHHMKYEHVYADKLKRSLEQKFEIESANVERAKLARMAKAHSFVKILMNPDRIIRIPDERIEFFLSEIKEVFGDLSLQEIADINVQKISREKTEAVSKLVTEKLEEYMTLEDFIFMWRSHFIETMKPKFMPEGWSITYSISYNLNDPQFSNV